LPSFPKIQSVWASDPRLVVLVGLLGCWSLTAFTTTPPDTPVNIVSNASDQPHDTTGFDHERSWNESWTSDDVLDALLTSSTLPMLTRGH
jgi:hypothetical protein